MSWQPFDLHPEYPPEGIPREQLLARYGGAAATERMTRFFAERGLEYNPRRDVVPNSMNALGCRARCDLGRPLSCTTG